MLRRNGPFSCRRNGEFVRAPRAAWRRGWPSGIGALCSAVATSMALVAAPLCFAQQQVDEADWKQGYHGVALLCRSMGMDVVDQIEEFEDCDPGESMLIVLGMTYRLPVDAPRYLAEGGALLVASDRGMPGFGATGMRFHRGPFEAARAEDALAGFRDCPVVTRVDAEHPITSGVSTLAANRPGALQVVESSSPPRGQRLVWRRLAFLPPLRNFPSGRSQGASGPLFLAASEARSGGRVVAAADQSLFVNQMLVRDDNARLLVNILGWLGANQRKYVLILDQSRVAVPSDPMQVRVQPRPPTPEEVQAALRNLPPSMLVDFANGVLQTAEDEALHDEMLTWLQRQLPSRMLLRLGILLASAVAGVVLIRGLAVRAAAGESVLDGPASSGGLSRRRQDELQRQSAAAHLLNLFRTQLYGSSSVPWEVFASRLHVPHRFLQTRRIRRKLVRAGRRLDSKPPGYWTRRRLRVLEGEVRRWWDLHHSGQLACARPADETVARSLTDGN